MLERRGVFHLPSHLLFIVLIQVDVLLPHQMTTWPKNIRGVRRRGKQCTKLKGLQAAGVARTGKAAVALVGEGDHQGEDDAKDGEGMSKGDVGPCGAVPI